MKKELEKLINYTITLKNRGVIFYKNIKGTPLPNGEVDCEERLMFQNIFELVNFFNNLKDENIAGYYNVDDDESNLYVYLRGIKNRNEMFTMWTKKEREILDDLYERAIGSDNTDYILEKLSGIYNMIKENQITNLEYVDLSSGKILAKSNNEKKWKLIAIEE